MAKLILNPTSPARRDFPLPRTVLSIGRDPSNDLVLPDAMVSRRHAVIECRGSQFYLRDCNSSNGSLVNGDRVSERGLRDGDLVAIGTVRLMFREEAEPVEPGAKVVQHPSAPRLVCPGCQADYRKGDLFCRQCGARLQQADPRVVCTACGTAVLLPARFCNACGTPLVKPDGASEARVADGAAPAAEGEVRTDEGPAASAAATPQESVAPAAGVIATGDEPPAASVASAGAAGDDRPTGEPPLATADEFAVPSAGLRLAPLGRAAAAPAQPPLVRGREPRSPVPALRAVPVRAPRAETPPTSAVPDALRQTTHAVDSRPLAAPGARLAAALIDAALVSAGVLLLTSPAALFFRRAATDPAGPGFLPILASVSLALLALVASAGYYVYFWGVRGATPGKQLLGLRVYGLDGRFPVGAQRASLRLLGYLLSAAALGLGFVVILFGATSLHDRVARTVVVRERVR